MPSEYAFITGGAGGLGKAIATRLASKGIKIFIADCDEIGAKATAEELNGYYGAVDVTSWESQLSAFQRAVGLFGRIDYVFALAGVGENDWMPPNTQVGIFQKPHLSVIEVNVTGFLYTVSLAVQQFRRQTQNMHGIRGKAIVAGSVCGVYCCPGLPIYTTSKHAVTGLVRSWGKALTTEGIRLNCLNPNVMRTSFSTGQFYQELEKEDLLTPIHGAVDVSEKLVEDHLTSGECFEIGPNYDSGQGAVKLEFTDFIDDKSRRVFDKLAQRGQAKSNLSCRSSL